jgi:hypothetical protein
MTLFWRMLLGTIRDLTPVLLVVLFFQVAVLQQPLSPLLSLVEGTVLVLAGLVLLVYGLELALFPLGEALADALARRGSFLWLIAFAFLLGFGTTFAEPALTAVAAEAARAAASSGAIEQSLEATAGYALGLRFVVALAVGTALTLGVTRIVLGWPLPVILMTCYALVVLLTFFTPPEIVGIAYDSGAVTTSIITVPLVTALGIGLASALPGRNPLSDGFGNIALVMVVPMVFVLAYGVLRAWI